MAFKGLHGSFVVGHGLTRLVLDIKASVVTLLSIRISPTAQILTRTYVWRNVVHVLNDFWERKRQLKRVLFANTFYTSMVTSVHTEGRRLKFSR
jgi:hypothetical protein